MMSKIFSAKVLFTYTPKLDDELPLKEVGQVITIISKSTEDPGWLLAEIDGKKGLIPDNFVEILRSTTTCIATSDKVLFVKFICAAESIVKFSSIHILANQKLHEQSFLEHEF